MTVYAVPESAAPARRPRATAPLRLTTSVPIGKLPPRAAETAPSSRKRAIAITPPSAATATHASAVTAATPDRVRRNGPIAAEGANSSEDPRAAGGDGGEVDAGEATGDRRRGVGDGEPEVAAFDHLEELQLQGRERRQGAAEAGRQEGAPVGRGGQPLAEAGHEPAEQRGGDHVRDEGRPGPRVDPMRQRLRQPDPRQRADHPAHVDRPQLPAIESSFAHLPQPPTRLR